MSEQDYITSSKCLLGEWLSVQSKARLVLSLYGDGIWADANLSEPVVRCIEMPWQWVHLAREWVDANNCSANSVRRAFFDLECWYEPALGEDIIYGVVERLSWIKYPPNYRSPSAPAIPPFSACDDAILRYMPYALYLQTWHWDELRRSARDRAGNRCQVCNAGGLLDVHHRTYERRGAELPEDLIVLCRKCHETFHKNGRLAR